MKKLDIKEVRELQLQILDKIHEFCESHNLRYSISGGTLIGAVRHGGFIPWDDDIDILMPRPDYEKLLSLFPNTYDNLYVDDHSVNPDYISAFAKIIDRRTFAIGPNIIDDRGIFIDIFPVDGMPDQEDEKLRNNIVSKMENMRRVGKYYKYTSDPVKKIIYFTKYCIKRIIYPSLNSSFNQLNAIISKYPFGTSKYAGVLISQYGYFRERQLTEVFLKYRDIKFEDRIYRCVEDYNSYLTTLYGDYMQLPPESERVPKHFTETYIDIID